MVPITKYSKVLEISNIDFTPAETTATGVLPSSTRSEEISIAAKIIMIKQSQISQNIVFQESD